MLEKMKEIIAEQLNVDESEVELTSSFKDDLGADSLDLFELVMALEEEYERLPKDTKNKLIIKDNQNVTSLIKNPILIKNKFNYKRRCRIFCATSSFFH